MNAEAGRTCRQMPRRTFLKAATGALLAAGCAKPPAPSAASGVQRMIVLGIDGMDPQLMRRFIDEGRLPNCQRLIERGSFLPLGTSCPPQSPVAWSNFVSGCNPGGHGIFDFIARDPLTMQPYHSVSRLTGTSSAMPLGNWRIPLGAAAPQNLRRGVTFWEELELHGVDCTVLRVPANFPPTKTDAVTLSGMGTPDLQGNYGTFTYFTDDPKHRSREVSGGRIEKVVLDQHHVRCQIRGPANEFLADNPSVEVTLEVDRDPVSRVARLVVQNTTLVLAEGEWSDWIVVRFSLMPYAVEVSGICRVLLKGVHEPFGLYVSSVNINPAEPSAQISTPPDYARQLVREIGYFYTQGMVEDTHALSAGVLTAAEYRQQALFVHDERLRFYQHELQRFQQGFLFYYFSTLDLSSHMFWRALDPGHPQFTAELAQAHGDFIGSLYERVDQAIGETLATLDEQSWLMVVSDHGFTSFRRQFNLNSWLLDHGYLQTTGPAQRAAVLTGFPDVDWSRTRAYGLGINGLYVNRKGREVYGTVGSGDADRLIQELVSGLEAVRDPETGERVIERVFVARDVYSGPYAEAGPDLIVGYRPNYRASWDTVLGGIPRQHVVDNRDPWSGDHCVAPMFVPGVLLSSRPLRSSAAKLEDLAPTILRGFGVSIPDEMTGTPLI
ncbi:MAG: alkaline phosphatase family protein [Planctomycetes bacterium]|nr:alkaline phosphatase family protein [Planctomycetota bacterium]